MNYKFNNGDLNFHKDKIIRFCREKGRRSVRVSKAFLPDCDAPYYLDVEAVEESYFYHNEKDRDEDCAKLKRMIFQTLNHLKIKV